MDKFNQCWWNCFLSYTDVISFSMAAYDFARDQMNDAGVTVDEIDEVLTNDSIMTDRTREVLIEYKEFLK